MPAYNWWNEALHGVARAGMATVFPQAIGIAATFNNDLFLQAANVISTEARAKYNLSVAAGPAFAIYGPYFLVAQYQYLSRSTLGPRTGNLW